MKTGKVHKSRKESDFMKRMKPEERERYIKQWISACNPHELIPFITITKHDKNFREIEYTIDIPNSEGN